MLNIQKNILLAPYTTFKIGGEARYFCEAENIGDIQELCKWAKNEKVSILVLGGGSNVLISDKGFGGLVIKIRSTKLEIRNSEIFAEAGAPLAKLVAEATKNNLTGLEWAIGIPGTIGGAINGNSGAFGKSISDVLEEVKVLDISALKIRIFKKDQCEFGYRNSIFKHNQDLVILSAILRLNKGEKEEMQKIIKDYTKQRIESNPAGRSAGCFFKNIEWQEVGDKEKLIKKFPELNKFSEKPKISVGFLIEQVGLKGKKIGGAVISEKHAAFIINSGKATADDVINLSNLIKQKVSERYRLNLKEEAVIV